MIVDLAQSYEACWCGMLACTFTQGFFLSPYFGQTVIAMLWITYLIIAVRANRGTLMLL